LATAIAAGLKDLQYIKVFTACPYLLSDRIGQSKAPEQLENAENDCIQGAFKLFDTP
jgi:hypothetical protein